MKKIQNIIEYSFLLGIILVITGVILETLEADLVWVKHTTGPGTFIICGAAIASQFYPYKKF